MQTNGEAKRVTRNEDGAVGYRECGQLASLLAAAVLRSRLEWNISRRHCRGYYRALVERLGC